MDKKEFFKKAITTIKTIIIAIIVGTIIWAIKYITDYYFSPEDQRRVENWICPLSVILMPIIMGWIMINNSDPNDNTYIGKDGLRYEKGQNWLHYDWEQREWDEWHKKE